MGASVSTNIQESKSDMVTEAYNKCASVNSTQSITLTDVEFTPPDTCKEDSTFNIEQKSSVNANCVISNLQKSVSDQLLKSSAKAQAGIGIAAALNSTNVETEVKNLVKNDCGDIVNGQTGKFEKLKIKSCKFYYIQEADLKTQCTLDSLQSTALKLTSIQDADAEGASLSSLLGTGGIVTMIIVAILVFVLFGAYMYMNDGDLAKGVQFQQGPPGTFPNRMGPGPQTFGSKPF